MQTHTQRGTWDICYSIANWKNNSPGTRQPLYRLHSLTMGSKTFSKIHQDLKPGC